MGSKKKQASYLTNFLDFCIVPKYFTRKEGGL